MTDMRRRARKAEGKKMILLRGKSVTLHEQIEAKSSPASVPAIGKKSMVRVQLVALSVILTASAAQAAECDGLGLPNDYLQQHFCAQLRDLATGDQGTRSILDGSAGAEDGTPPEPWEAIPIIRDAYRADPKKTLALIERIRNAGGLVDQ
jgi:hypothetical protein